MAEFGAHLATAASELPSIFEVLAQENLTSTLRPAFGHLLKVIAQFDIAKFGPLWRWRDEIYAVFELVLQHYCLKTCGASFAENFYGLKRSPAGKYEKMEPMRGYRLPRRHHYKALACLVLAPYLKLKSDSLFERLRDETAASDSQSNDRQNGATRKGVKDGFSKVYPLVHLVCEILTLCFQIGYALGRVTFPSPLYLLSSTRLHTLTEDDQTDKPFKALWDDVRFSNWKNLPLVVAFHLTRNTRGLFTATLSLGSFFLQFIEWWYSNSLLPNNLAVSIVPPPEKENRRISLKAGLCPLCYRARTNDTALSTSGFVFCYRCIYEYVRANGKCPMTKLPSSTVDLIRLFTNCDT